MRLAALSLLLSIVALYSMEAALASRVKRFPGFHFKSFKLTRRPSPPPPPPEVKESIPDTSFVVEKPPSTTRPRLALEEKFAMELASSGIRPTTPPNMQLFQTKAGGLWDFLP